MLALASRGSATLDRRLRLLHLLATSPRLALPPTRRRRRSAEAKPRSTPSPSRPSATPLPKARRMGARRPREAQPNRSRRRGLSRLPRSRMAARPLPGEDVRALAARRRRARRRLLDRPGVRGSTGRSAVSRCGAAIGASSQLWIPGTDAHGQFAPKPTLVIQEQWVDWDEGADRLGDVRKRMNNGIASNRNRMALAVTSGSLAIAGCSGSPAGSDPPASPQRSAGSCTAASASAPQRHDRDGVQRNARAQRRRADASAAPGSPPRSRRLPRGDGAHSGRRLRVRLPAKRRSRSSLSAST